MSNDRVDITGLDKAAVLAALFNNARVPRMFAEVKMTTEDARECIDDQGDDLFFDYVGGRAVKADLSRDEIDPWGFDRDNGDGAMQRIIDQLRSEQNVTGALGQAAADTM